MVLGASKKTAEDLKIPSPEARGKGCSELSRASVDVVDMTGEGWRQLTFNMLVIPYHFVDHNSASEHLCNC